MKQTTLTAGFMVVLLATAITGFSQTDSAAATKPESFITKHSIKLDNKIIQTYPGKNIKLVSLAFIIPDRKPIKQVGGLYLYEY